MRRRAQSFGLPAFKIAYLNRVQRKIRQANNKENNMSIGMILLIVLVLALVGVIPAWGHSSSWGYGPTGGVGLLLAIVLILFLLGKI